MDPEDEVKEVNDLIGHKVTLEDFLIIPLLILIGDNFMIN